MPAPFCIQVYILFQFLENARKISIYAGFQRFREMENGKKTGRFFPFPVV